MSKVYHTVLRISYINRDVKYRRFEDDCYERANHYEDTYAFNPKVESAVVVNQFVVELEEGEL